MGLQHPAHVGHGVTHSASFGKIALGVTGLVVGAAIAIWAWPVAAIAEGTMTVGGALLGAAGTVSTSLGIGNGLGKLVDKFLGPSVAGHLTSGFPTVLLGPSVKQAARADVDTKADCAGDHVGWEGSDTVSLGNKPMSRVGDRLKCQGKICEGILTVSVGGRPSQQGEKLQEGQNGAVFGLRMLSDSLSLITAKTLLDRALAGLALGLDAVGDERGTDVRTVKSVSDIRKAATAAQAAKDAGARAAQAAKIVKGLGGLPF